MNNSARKAYTVAYRQIRSLHRAQRELELYDGWAINRYYVVWSSKISDHILEAALSSYQNRRISCGCEFCQRYQ